MRIILTAHSMGFKVCARQSLNGVLDYSADVVINAANSHLSHRGGLARALAHRIPELQSGSDQLVELSGILAAGEYRFQQVKDAPWETVCHMVAPQNASNIGVIKPMLVGAINASAGKGYRSIVLPLVGVGVYGLPMDKVCAAYYEALMEVKHLNISV